MGQGKGGGGGGGEGIKDTSNWYFSEDRVSSLHVTETTPVPEYWTTSANSVSSSPLKSDVKLSTPTFVRQQHI